MHKQDRRAKTTLIQACFLEAGLSRGDLTEAEWRIVKDLLPIERRNRGRGRPPERNRSIISGILWRLRCGAPWRDVPPKDEGWNTIYRRFRRWSEAGVWGIVAVTLAEIMADTRSAPTSRQQAEKGGSSTRPWPFAGRVHQ